MAGGAADRPRYRVSGSQNERREKISRRHPVHGKSRIGTIADANLAPTGTMHNARNLYGRGMSPAEHSVALCYRSPRTTKPRVVLRISACAANDPVADFGKRQKAQPKGQAKRPSHMSARALQIVKKDRHPDPRIAATCLSLLTTHIFAQQRRALCSSHYPYHPSLSLSRSDSVSPYISLLLSSLVQVPLVPVTCRRRDALFGSR